jgi:hypothetical protein
MLVWRFDGNVSFSIKVGDHWVKSHWQWIILILLIMRGSQVLRIHLEFFYCRGKLIDVVKHSSVGSW